MAKLDEENGQMLCELGEMDVFTEFADISFDENNGIMKLETDQTESALDKLEMFTELTVIVPIVLLVAVVTLTVKANKKKKKNDPVEQTEVQEN